MLMKFVKLLISKYMILSFNPFTTGDLLCGSCEVPSLKGYNSENGADLDAQTWIF